ncbi:hypothetical protein ACHAW6_010232 [Cyclotella cf. meneghiniana]
MMTGRQDETKTRNVSRTARITRHAPDDNSSAKQSITSTSRGSSVPPRRKTRDGNPEHMQYRASHSSYSDRSTRLASEQDRSSATQTTTPKHLGISVPPQQARRGGKALKQDSFSVSSKTSKNSIKNTTPKCSTYVVDSATKSSRNSMSKDRHDAKSVSSQSGRFTTKSTGESALSVAAKKPKKRSKRRNKDIDEGATRNTQASKKSIISAATDRIKKIFGMSSRQKTNNGTDATFLTTPMDVLHIPVERMSMQDLPACVVRGVDTNEMGHDKMNQSLTLGTPKRDRNMSCSESDPGTPVPCVNVPTLDTSQSECSSTKYKHKLQSSKSKSHKQKDDGMEVLDLHWTNGIVYGKYSGPINTSLQPHGRGTLKINGFWENGTLLYPDFNGPSATVVSRDVQTAISISSVKAHKHIVIPAAPGCKIEDEPIPPLKTTTDGTYPTDKLDSPEKSFSSRLSSSHLSSLSTEATDGTAKLRKNLRRSVHCTTQSHQKYHVGEVARSPNDMIIHRSYFDAIDSASMIQKMQQAFIKRSNGLWTCAVLVERAVQPINGKHWYTEWEINSAEMKLEESMLFVINDDGSTKIVNKRNWGKFVRRIKTNMNDGVDDVTDNKVDSRKECVMAKDYPVDDDAEDDADLVEDDAEEDASQHSTTNFRKEGDKALSGGIDDKSKHKNEESNHKMDATRESPNKGGIGDDINQTNVQEKRERDTMKTISEDKIIRANHGDKNVLFVRKSTSTTSTSLTWSSLSHSTSSKSRLLSNSMMSDID